MNSNYIHRQPDETSSGSSLNNLPESSYYDDEPEPDQNNSAANGTSVLSQDNRANNNAAVDSRPTRFNLRETIRNRFEDPDLFTIKCRSIHF